MSTSLTDQSVTPPKHPESPLICTETELRAAFEKMAERERRLMELLHTSSPDRIEHALRNVLNELGLLRTFLHSSSESTTISQ